MGRGGGMPVISQGRNARANAAPLPPGEQCTQRVDVDVTAGKKQASLSLRTRKTSPGPRTATRSSSGAWHRRR